MIGRDRWFESAGVKKDDFKGLADLILKEQIYESCSAELVTFLKERDPKNTSSIVSLAEQFQTAHPNAKLSKSHNLCAISTKFQERQSRSMSKDQDKNRHASAANYFARGPYNNRQTFRPGSYYMSQSNFTNRPGAPSQYSYVRLQFQSSSYNPTQQNVRPPNQVRQQFGPRNYKKEHT